VPGGDHQPGVVEAVSPDGIIIGTNGGAIRAKRVRVGAKKVPAAEFAAEFGVTPGTPLI